MFSTGAKQTTFPNFNSTLECMDISDEFLWTPWCSVGKLTNYIFTLHFDWCGWTETKDSCQVVPDWSQPFSLHWFFFIVFRWGGVINWFRYGVLIRTVRPSFFNLNRLRTCDLKPNQACGVALFIQEVGFDAYCQEYFQRITQISFFECTPAVWS